MDDVKWCHMLQSVTPPLLFPTPICLTSVQSWSHCFLYWTLQCHPPKCSASLFSFQKISKGSELCSLMKGEAGWTDKNRWKSTTQTKPNKLLQSVLKVKRKCEMWMDVRDSLIFCVLIKRISELSFPNAFTAETHTSMYSWDGYCSRGIMPLSLSPTSLKPLYLH